MFFYVKWIRDVLSRAAQVIHCVQLMSFIIISWQFEGTEIALDGRMGIFITMNPGYAGRTELPESVKALFRPVVCIVPDLQQICEIMLFSEGFLLAKVSAVMFLQRKWQCCIACKREIQHLLLTLSLPESNPESINVDETLGCDHSNESYWAVLSFGTVYYAVQD